MTKRILLMISLLLAMTSMGLAQDKPLLAQKPTVNRTQIVFAYAGDLWIVARDGGEAKRLTTGEGIETDPQFSPDGNTIAFTGEYDGNVDIYTVPATGGIPKRLTYHPVPDSVRGWTPDGRQILFESYRNSNNPTPRLFTVPAAGGLATEVPLPMGVAGSYSADGTQLAYVPTIQWQAAWKKYRGGQTKPIWIARLSDSSIEKLPRDNSNDSNPMWIGNKIYFLSDRNGAVTLYSYDTGSKKVTQAIPNSGLDIKSASAGAGAIVYEQFGSLNLYDIDSGKTKKVNVILNGDLPGVRPKFVKVGRNVQSATLSATGVRAVFSARGEIITVPAEKGNPRNLTNTSGAAERDPAWSPDGKWIAYFSDESGEYALHLSNQSGMGEVKKISLGNPSSFFYEPKWSPDSKKVAFTDKRLNLWYVDIEKGTPVKVDANTYENPWRVMDPDWSPDSKWITYTKQLDNHLGAVFAYSLDSNKSNQITDGLSDARFANFDKNGKYIYFTASTNAGPTSGWLDMSSFPHQVTRSAYVVVLKKDLPSPLAPQSDEEKIAEDKPAEAPKPPAKPEPVIVAIDFDNISQRILALPIPPKGYQGLRVGKTGIVYLLEGLGGLLGGGASTLHKFDLEKRKVDKVLDSITGFDISANGEKILFRQGPSWFIAATATPIQPGQGLVNLADVEVQVDPKTEWKQMYKEAWRIQRDFMYDPNLHGLDIKAAEAMYRPYLENVAHRADLNYLFTEMLGMTVLGHTFINGGDTPEPRRTLGGLLGADYKVENGRYRFARVYNGENWNPQFRAPLTGPGVNVVAGEYLIAVNGRNLTANEDVDAFFEGTAGKQIIIKVGNNPDGSNSREVTVVPISNDANLRYLAWIEDNRRKVDELSGGKLAYVHLPDTAFGGYTNFNRYYFAQINKEGAVLDERFNGGGTAADYIIDYMRRPLMNYWATREGKDFTTPVASIYGPKAMIINEFAGSGGDLMPWLFKNAKVGPLVGKRTWGGLVGIYDYPPLIDGGAVTAPRVAFYNLNGEWDVENHGTDPDVEVEFDPALWRQGRDPQLEKAVEVVMDLLKKNPLPKHKKPAYPNYYKTAPAATSGNN
jgi:tricorn protease